MDLKDYFNKTETKSERQPTPNDVQGAINRFSKMSNDQLMSELAKHMGNQTPENIKQTIERIKPLLNAEQQKRMEEILRNVGAR